MRLPLPVPLINEADLRVGAMVVLTLTAYLVRQNLSQSIGVAFVITGSRWNGPRFFGLRDRTAATYRTNNVATEQMAATRRLLRCGILMRLTTASGQ
jgi:hypothetical protein